MIACDVDNLGSMFAHAKYATHYITMTLTPPPFVLLYLPTIDDVTNQEQILTAMMLEEVVEYIGFGIFSAKVCVGNADRLVFCLVHIVFKHI